MNPLIKLNEERKVNIESIGKEGDGIAKIEGYVIIVPKAIQGKRYLIKIRKVKPKFSFAEILKEI